MAIIFFNYLGDFDILWQYFFFLKQNVVSDEESNILLHEMIGKKDFSNYLLGQIDVIGKVCIRAKWPIRP